MTPNTERLNVVIPIGGSGMRVAEAMVHLAASGFIGNVGSMYIFPVDPDVDNENLLRLIKAVNLYREIREKLVNNLPKGLNNPPIFATYIEDINRLGQLTVLGGIRTIEEIFWRPSADDSGHNPVNSLIEALYTYAEMNQSLDQGFRGRPAIGVPVILYRVPQERAWENLLNLIRLHIHGNARPRIILVGSVFGGTGASGLPALSSLLREEFDNDIKIAGIFMLPYFRFNMENIQESGILANPDTFNHKALQALRYYGISGYDRIFDHIYMVGLKYPFIFRKFSPGGQEQDNPITIIDLIAATAIKDFLNRRFLNNSTSKISFINTYMSERDIIFSSLHVNGPYGRERPITYINLFIILSIMLLAFFGKVKNVARSRPIGYRIFEFMNTMEIEYDFMEDMFKYMKYYLQFIKEVAVIDEDKYMFMAGGIARVNLIPDIILNSLKRIILDGYVFLEEMDHLEKAEADEFKRILNNFLNEYRELFVEFNKRVINILANRTYRNEAEFLLYLYSAIAYHSYALLRGPEDEEWARILEENTVKIIKYMIQIILSYLGINLKDSALNRLQEDVVWQS